MQTLLVDRAILPGNDGGRSECARLHAGRAGPAGQRQQLSDGRPHESGSEARTGRTASKSCSISASRRSSSIAARRTFPTTANRGFTTAGRCVNSATTTSRCTCRPWHEVARKHRGHDFLVMPRAAYTGSRTVRRLLGRRHRRHRRRPARLDHRRAARGRHGLSGLGLRHLRLQPAAARSRKCAAAGSRSAPSRRSWKSVQHGTSAFWNLPTPPSYDETLIALWRTVRAVTPAADRLQLFAGPARARYRRTDRAARRVRRPRIA